MKKTTTTNTGKFRVDGKWVEAGRNRQKELAVAGAVLAGGGAGFRSDCLKGNIISLIAP